MHALTWKVFDFSHNPSFVTEKSLIFLSACHREKFFKSPPPSLLNNKLNKAHYFKVSGCFKYYHFTFFQAAVRKK